jgi:phosphoribosyl-ATP pyrophosphohydrolase
MSDTLGQALDQLLADVADKAAADPSHSYTAKLLQGGPVLCGKKLGEEGVETALAIAGGTAEEVAKEAADLLYHLSVGLLARGVSGADVAHVLEARRGTSGLVEKAGRSGS